MPRAKVDEKASRVVEISTHRCAKSSCGCVFETFEDDKPTCPRCHYDSRSHALIRRTSYQLVRIR